MSRTRKAVPIQKILLYTVAGVGLIAAVAIAPGIGPALRVFGVGKKSYSKQYVSNAISRLRAKGLIEFEEKKGKRFIRLTATGKTRLDKYILGEYTIPKPKKWDGKWRIVMFDIQEHKRSIRDSIRGHLIRFGFVKLQHSAWIHPYECEELITMLKSSHHIGKRVVYIVAEEVQYDKDLKKHFKL